MKKAKVISVGNIVMGGTGKTPHTIEIVREYVKRGENTVVLSRGYRGKLGYGTNIISDGKNIFHRPPLAADEPYMIALNCPGAAVITGKNRSFSLSCAQERFGSALAVLDDGFQHRDLERDANILLLDYKNPLSTGLPFPFGYLREMPSAISRADIIVFTRACGESVPEKTKKYAEGKPVFFSRPITDKIIFGNETVFIKNVKGFPAAAFSAVALNRSFYGVLSAAGIDIKVFKGLRDHSVPSEKKLENFIKTSAAKGAEYFITTEKDFVKLPEKYQKIFGYLKMEIEIECRDAFFNKIDELIKA